PIATHERNAPRISRTEATHLPSYPGGAGSRTSAWGCARRQGARARRPRVPARCAAARSAQFAAQDLPDVRFGQTRAELDRFRHLVAGQLLAAVREYLLLGEGRIALDDHDLHRLVALGVGHADRADLGHAGKLRDDRLDL